MLSTGSKRKVWLAAAFASGAAVKLLEDAGAHPVHAWVVAHHEAPGELAPAQIIELGD